MAKTKLPSAPDPEEVASCIAQLSDKRSPKRRGAAIKLRKLGAKEAGPALLEALEKELEKDVTWETQYQMIRALGEIDYRPALPRLRELARRDFEATMVYMAIGNALVRLARSSDEDPEPLLNILNGGYPRLLVSGAMVATAALQMKFPPGVAATVLSQLPKREPGEESDLFFPAIACAGWSGPAVDAFLSVCEKSRLASVREAAADARKGKYRKFSLL